jgi:hypothetical protein
MYTTATTQQIHNTTDYQYTSYIASLVPIVNLAPITFLLIFYFTIQWWIEFVGFKIIQKIDGSIQYDKNIKELQ